VEAHPRGHRTEGFCRRGVPERKENTPHTARMAHDQALRKAMRLLLKEDTQVYKQFVENESFKRFVGDMVYALTSLGESATSVP
jgi:hypothetical protein